MSIAQQFIQMNGIMFKVIRENTVIGELKGRNTQDVVSGRSYIGFMPESDVQAGDTLINPAGDNFYVTDKSTSYFMGKASELQAFYSRPSNVNSPSSQTNIFNIGTATGSVIGTQSHFSMSYCNEITEARNKVDSENSIDKKELSEILDLLQELVEETKPAKKGMFSKFSTVMQRNPWISTLIGSVVTGWLKSQSQ